MFLQRHSPVFISTNMASCGNIRGPPETPVYHGNMVQRVLRGLFFVYKYGVIDGSFDELQSLVIIAEF